MYIVSKLTKDSQDFLAYLAQSNLSRSVAGSISLARALSNRISLPPEPVESIAAYFALNHKAEINQAVSTINELVLLDTDAVVEYTAKFFQFRYNIAHPMPHVLALKKETAIVDFFAISRAFDAASLMVIEEEHLRITDMANKFKNLLCEMQGGN